MRLQGQIAALPGVASVDTFDNYASTPSDATLDQYDVVVTTDDFPPVDAVALGNNLADYEDQGGVVVATEFFWQSSGGDAAAGRWLTGGYSPYQVGTSDEFTTVTLGAHDATSPLLQGVSSLTDFYHENPALAAGATEIAKWSDGFSAVAFKGNAVGINAYIGNSNASSWSGDYAKIIVNAGNVLGRHTLTITKGGTGAGSVTSVPAGINCGATCAFNYTNGTAVTLTAVASSGSSFTGWSGACSGTSTCTVTMNAAQSVTAKFTIVPPHGTTITKAKINKIKHTASFTVAASGTVTGFQCALIKPKKKGKHHKKAKLVFKSCSSPKTYKHLKHGRYTFEVRAVNSTAPDPTSAIKKFQI